MRECHYCGTTHDELRPYGPGGAWLCYPCMKATPEREAQAHRAFGALLDAAEQIAPTGIVAIGGQDGPQPFDQAAIDGGGQ